MDSNTISLYPEFPQPEEPLVRIHPPWQLNQPFPTWFGFHNGDHERARIMIEERRVFANTKRTYYRGKNWKPITSQEGLPSKEAYERMTQHYQKGAWKVIRDEADIGKTGQTITYLLGDKKGKFLFVRARRLI